MLWTSRLLKIVELSFNKILCTVELRFEFTKFTKGVMFITPDIGKSGFY